MDLTTSTPRRSQVARTYRFRMGLTLGIFAFLGCLLGGLKLASNADDAATPKNGDKTEVVAESEIPPNPFPKRIPAVELDGGEEWLNSSGPISIKDLRGKIVLLDFWTYCCINCMHVLPDLAYLEQKFDKELVVIGVHSAKFDNEKVSGNIRKAIQRYEIEHPVVNDSDMVIWRKFGVRAWPTLVLIDPEGFTCGYVSGEGNRDLLEQVLKRLVAHHKAKGTLDETPVHFDLESRKQPPTPLRFPGKVLADSASRRLFIADSNHNRIVVTTFEGQLQDVIGSGAIGSQDGGYDAAEFDHPQGLALVKDRLYVADTENHLIRIVDLKSKQVGTLAGTGEQGDRRLGTGKLRATALNSPWDLLSLDGVLYIAMAGPHQIWSHQLGSDKIQPYAGSGREDILNGPLEEAALAQPSGLATDGRFLFVVDSEGSSIRKITTKPDNELARPMGSVTTIVGTSDLPGGRCLFEFGDVDGEGNQARFQHPLGIAYDNGQLFVADSYNHKIKRVNVTTRVAETWLGTGRPGSETAAAQLSEPGGLAISGRQMFIADTNNHRICVVNLETRRMDVLTITGLTPPQPRSRSEDNDATTATVMPAQKLTAGKPITFTFEPHLPPGYKLNPQASVAYRVTASTNEGLIPTEALGARDEAEPKGDGATFTLPVTAKSGETNVEVTVTYTYCRDGASGLCKLGTAKWRIPLVLTAESANSTITLKAGAAE